MTADDIIEGLIGVSQDKIWVKELPLFAGGRRIDFWTLEPSFSKGYRATSYEVKISRGDFKRDSDEKQAGALSYSDRFFYVTTPGLLKRDEVPDWSGLMEWDGKNFSVRRRAPKRKKHEPNWEFVVSALRGSAQFGRDAGLTLAENAYLKHRLAMIERAQKAKQERDMDRWLRQHARAAE